MQITRKNLNRLISEEYTKILNEHDQDTANQLDPKLISIAHEEALAHLAALNEVIGSTVYEIVSHCANSGNQSSTDDMYSAACVVIERMIDKIFDTHRTAIVSEFSDELTGSTLSYSDKWR